MIQEWFCGILGENGHVRLDGLVRVTEWMTVEHVRERLNRVWETVYLIEVPVEDLPDAYARSAKVVNYLTENGTDLGDWTSLIDNGTLVFAFRSAQAAVQFRLMLP
jgi:hypothetical protein